MTIMIPISAGQEGLPDALTADWLPQLAAWKSALMIYVKTHVVPAATPAADATPKSTWSPRCAACTSER